MGSARSARRIQPGGVAAPAGTADPSRDRRPVGLGRRRAHFLRGGAPRPAPGRLGRAGGEGGSPLRRRALQRPSLRPRRFPRGRGQCLRAFSPPDGGGTGPPAPRSDVDRSGPSSVRPDRAGRPGRGPALVKGARGPRRRRPPTRPVLKHGPRSLTRARVGGCPRAPEAQRR